MSDVVATPPAPVASAPAPATTPAASPPAPVASATPGEVITPAATPTPPAAPSPPPSKAGLLGDVDPWSEVPDKYAVKKDDGTLDQAATFAKVEKARKELEGRLGRPDVRPKDADSYTIPDVAKDIVKSDDPEFAAFRRAAFTRGFSQSQMDFVVEHYAGLAPKLVQGAMALDAKAAETNLREGWGDAFEENVGYADRAILQLAPGDQEVLRAVQNRPPLIRLLAKIGEQLREDSPPPGTDATRTPDDINTLLMHPAYSDPKHAEHKSISERVNAFYASQPGAKVPIT